MLDNGEIYTRYSINEEGFKKMLLILQLVKYEAMTMASLRRETKIENIQQFVDILVDMGYLKATKPRKEGRVKRRNNHTKYRAVYQIKKIA